ncbi:MAG: GNAT family N-acetyltransferase, partial [Acidobacteriota bacterium]|nr:GNAT family N-acetyltransferase [Acidobacteriota bacterium]
MIEEIESIEGLEALGPEWRELWARCPEATPFQSPQWLLPWLQNLYKGGEIWALVLRCEGRLAGIAPLLLHRHWRNFEVRQVSFIGAGISDYLDVLIEPALARSGARAFLRHLKERRSRWDVCDFQELRAASPLLTSTFPDGVRRDVSACGICPVVKLPESMELLRKSLPPKFRADLHRAANRLRNSGGAAFETATAETLPEFLEALFQLHSARWELRHEPGMLCSDRIRNFHRQVASGFQLSGSLRVHGLRQNGTIGAVVYSFVTGTTAYAYLGGFDPALARLSPGSMLMEFSIERAIQEGV